MKSSVNYKGQEIKVGTNVRILEMDDRLRGAEYEGKTGTVEYIDDMGQLHGTWGGLAIIPEIDTIQVLD